jgi:hypothetical protein
MALTYTQLTALTNKLIKKKLTEGVFKNDALLARFRKNQELEDGGTKITCPLFSVDDTGSTGEFYEPTDALALTTYDGISASEHEWRYIQESIVIYKADIAKNGGDSGKVKLVSSKVKQAEMAMKQRMIKGILSDGGASLGAADTDQFDGLEAIIASSGTYGGIAPADLATWVSYVDDNAGVDRALTQAMVDKAYDQTVENGIGGASLGIMDKSVFTKFKGLLTGQQRVMREDTVSGQGHKGQTLVYNGIDHMIVNLMPANTLFYVDEEHVKLHVHREHNMRRQSITDLETADALLERIFLYGNLIASERKFNSRINDIAV